MNKLVAAGLVGLSACNDPSYEDQWPGQYSLRCREDEGCVLSLDRNQEGPLQDLQIERISERTALSIKDAALDDSPFEAASEAASDLAFQHFTRGEAYGWINLGNEAGTKKIASGHISLRSMPYDRNQNTWIIVQEVICENGESIRAMAAETTGDGFYDHREFMVDDQDLPPENFTTEFPFLQDKPVHRYDALPGGRVLYRDWIADLPEAESDFRKKVCNKVAQGQ